MDYGKYMRQALALARVAAAAGEVPVGAVLVCGGEVIAAAANGTEAQGSALAHAELLTLQSASATLGRRYFSDCTLFVTMEPCPMCAGAIVLARVGTVVYGCPDSRWGGCGSIFNVPEHKQSGFKPQLVGGVCEGECRELLQTFFRQRRAE